MSLQGPSSVEKAQNGRVERSGMLMAGGQQALQEASYLRATAPVLTLHGNLKAAAEDRLLARCLTTAFVTNPTRGTGCGWGGGGWGVGCLPGFQSVHEEGAGWEQTVSA